jgi:triacylglycerol lipase
MPRHSSLARLSQLVASAQLLAAGAWLAWRWPVSPAQAVAGVLLLVLSGPAVLAVECVFAACVSGEEDATPRASLAQWLRAWAAESIYLFRVFGWRQPFRWRVVDDHLDAACAGRTGVVFVHGFMCNRGFWNPWMQLLRERGHAFAAVNLEPIHGSIDAYVPLVEAAVLRVRQATGRAPVLVCHSMGGVAARAWWRAGRGSAQVARIVTIGSPHRGTWMSRFSRHLNVRQMGLGSAWLEQLARDEAGHPLPPMTCWYSNCDNMVFPAATATLPRADNRFLPGQPHVALAFATEVVGATLATLQQGEPGRQGESVTTRALENG